MEIGNKTVGEVGRKGVVGIQRLTAYVEALKFLEELSWSGGKR